MVIDNFKPMECPISHKYYFTENTNLEETNYCRHCGWKDDPLMEDEPDKWAGCANPLCLNDYRKEYQKLISEKPDYKWKKDHKTK